MSQVEGTTLRRPGARRRSKRLRVQKMGEAGPFPGSQNWLKGQSQILIQAGQLQAPGSPPPTAVGGSSSQQSETRGDALISRGPEWLGSQLAAASDPHPVELPCVAGREAGWTVHRLAPSPQRGPQRSRDP